MPLPKRGGTFFQCVLRTSAGTPLNFASAGTFDRRADSAFDGWMTSSNQLTDIPPASATPEEFSYHFNRAMPPPSAPVSGSTGTAGFPEASFLYLDVGAWIGSINKPWGSIPPDNGLRRGLKRDFGIVCGPHVLLCSFEHATPGAPTDAGWTAVAGQSGQAIQSLVALLAAASATSSLGKAIVTRYLSAAATNPKWNPDEKNWTLHVITGDMHIPVLDTIDQSRTQPIPEEGWGTKLLISMGNADNPNINVNQPRVKRYGRLDLLPVEMVVGSLIGPNDTNEVEKVINLLGGNHSAGNIWNGTKAVATVLADVNALQTVNDPFGVGDDTMTTRTAERWFQYYRQGVDGGLPADIFEEAGQHLLEFVTALKSYRQNNGSLLPVQFHQLGDMLDFWVGFTSHFIPSNSNEHAVTADRSASDSPGKSYGRDLVAYWGNNIFTNTAQGKLVAQAIEYVSAASLGVGPSFLWGNHDNYLGAGLTPSYTFQGAGRTLQQRKPNFPGDGLFMEHGHQWEEANADNAPVLGGTGMLLGTDSPMGMTVTQAAFIRPKPVRHFEGEAAGFMAKRSHETYGQRMTQLAYAADRFVNLEGAFYCYVMGHTHSPCLSRVKVRTDADRPLIDLIRRDGSPAQTTLDVNNQAFNLPGIGTYPAPDLVTAYDVGVSWEGMLGLGQHDWIQLDDPAQMADGTRRKGFWKWIGDGKKKGSVAFHNVPAGYYIAKAYLDAHDTKRWQQEQLGVYVHGVSIEALPTSSLDDGDTTDTQGSQFTFSGDATSAKFDNPVVFRWVLDAQQNESEPLWMGLFRQGDLKKLGRPLNTEDWDAVGLAAASIRKAASRPIRFLKDLSPPHPTYGRWPLEPEFVKFIARHTGVGQTTGWELRVFIEQMQLGYIPPGGSKFKSVQVGPTLPFKVTRKA